MKIFNRLFKKKLFVDCGANIGEITSRYLKDGYKVIAFEPNPHVFKVLEQKFGKNRNVSLFNKAVWHRDDVLRLHLHENSDEDEVYWSQGGSLLPFKGNVLEEKFIEVEVVDLITFLGQLNIQKIDVLKIDIEGAEVELLDKIIETKFYRNVGEILVETHDHKIHELKTDTDRIRNLIEKLGITNINLDWM